MSWNPLTVAQLNPGNYIEAGTLAGHKADVTLERWAREEVGQEKEMVTVAYFRGKQMGMIMNKINLHCLAAIFGPHVPDWMGKTFTIYATDQVMPFPGLRGEEAMCLRIYGAPHMENPIKTVFKVGRRKVPITLHPHRKLAPKQVGPELDENGDRIGGDA